MSRVGITRRSISVIYTFLVGDAHPTPKIKCHEVILSCVPMPYQLVSDYERSKQTEMWGRNRKTVLGQKSGVEANLLDGERLTKKGNESITTVPFLHETLSNFKCYHRLNNKETR